MQRVSIGCGLLLAVAATAATPAGWSLSGQYWATRKPNLILVLADAVGCDQLGGYGATDGRTPHLDRLAAEGMRFTQAYTGSPDNPTSRACLLTGRHAGAWPAAGAGEFQLPADAVTVGALLRAAGYVTGVLGVWGIGTPASASIPPRQGFDEWLGYLSLRHAEDFYPTQLWRNADLLMLEKNFYHYRGLPATDLIIQAATNFVRVNKFKPFFLYLAYPPLSPSPAPSPRPQAATLQRLDADVGRLLAEVGRLNLSNHTLVVFTSTALPPPPGQRPHAPWPHAAELSEARLRVPLMARWPGKIPPGTASDRVVAFWDFLPTALDLAQPEASRAPRPSPVAPPAGSCGISVLPTLLGRPQTNAPGFLYWESHRHGLAQAARWGDWKAIRDAPASALRLYQVRSDPGEATNLAPQYPGIAARLATTLDQTRPQAVRGRSPN
ncbi:MAG: sulfatase-like hydrolase/transferase [Verrucomicrobia bacterium]|nr:sulfatase-like hydrolase/transferase [Verrucomicrobiota bacterium]